MVIKSSRLVMRPLTSIEWMAGTYMAFRADEIAAEKNLLRCGAGARRAYGAGHGRRSKIQAEQSQLHCIRLFSLKWCAGIFRLPRETIFGL
ncbi:hypothetical protein PY365_12060 [Roseiarcaceae bacterium H3SJ34-1]|uniref:hypothetical protein n=1 Tax=Terripilifer ovatus TaxID=3032367 RepID=UPI003AB99D71|nr:hypothetical protein [Roseiarcaceae bacterium H3SJ34-1]